MVGGDGEGEVTTAFGEGGSAIGAHEQAIIGSLVADEEIGGEVAVSDMLVTGLT